MIVKNEESRLPGFLEVYAGCFDEIIIADTGSTDRTKNIVAAFAELCRGQNLQVKLYETAWENDFSKARNLTLEKASSEWIMWLDADDSFDKAYFDNLKSFLGNTVYNAVRLPVYSVSTTETVLSEHPSPLYQIRVFRNSSGLRFKGFLHEYIETGREQAADFDFPVLHLGYADRAESERKEKRNFELITSHLRTAPADVYALFLYGEYLKKHKLWGEEAGEVFHRFFMLKKEKDFTFYKMKLSSARNLYFLGKVKESMENVFDAIDLFPRYAEAYLWLGGYFYVINRLEYAEEYFLKALALEGEKFCGRLAFPLDYRYIPLINLGRIESEKGNKEKSDFYFKEALKYRKQD